MNRRHLAAVPCALLVLLAACGTAASTDLEQAVIAAEPGAGIAVLSAAGITAGRLCILGPYTGAGQFEDVTGVQWPQVENEAIVKSDSIELVVAISGDEVVAWAEGGVLKAAICSAGQTGVPLSRTQTDARPPGEALSRP